MAKRERRSKIAKAFNNFGCAFARCFYVWKLKMNGALPHTPKLKPAKEFIGGLKAICATCPKKKCKGAKTGDLSGGCRGAEPPANTTPPLAPRTRATQRPTLPQRAGARYSFLFSERSELCFLSFFFQITLKNFLDIVQSSQHILFDPLTLSF